MLIMHEVVPVLADSGASVMNVPRAANAWGEGEHYHGKLYLGYHLDEVITAAFLSSAFRLWFP